MSKLWIVLIAVAVLAVAGFFVFSGNKNDFSTDNNFGNSIGTTGQVPDENTASSGSDSGAVSNSGSSSQSETVRISSEYTVSISGFAFSPSTINLKAGDEVIWLNNDSSGHTVTSDTGNELGSVILGKGDDYRHVFNRAGTYDYHCSLHSRMSGKIVVS